MTADALAEAARLVARMRPDWQRPERFHETKAEALAAIRAAVAAAPCAQCPADALRDRARRLEALLRHAGAETARLRRMLASAAARPPRRRPAALDPRQAALPFG
jgi:hypothetical protein